MEEKLISIIIPAYNESARIGKALNEVAGCIREHGWNTQVLVVDDGSTDSTAAIVREFARGNPEVELLANAANRGKGFSVRRGALAAAGDIIMFTDADLSAPLTEAELLFAALRDGADVAIGSRWLDRSRQTVQQPLYRRFLGRCFNAVTRLIMRLPFADTQCGFKAFRRPAARRLFQMQLIERCGFDPEILFLALKEGYSVSEVPVSWAHDDRSRLSYFRDGLRMLQDLLAIRWYSLTGAYRRRQRASTPVPEDKQPTPTSHV